MVNKKVNLGEEREINLSRRKFLVEAGALATGVLIAGIAGCSANPAEEKKESEQKAANNTSDTSAKAPSLPWKYAKLDVEKIRKRGYELYYDNGRGCMYGVAAALVEGLKEAVGSPWDTIPTAMFAYGKGGVYGWGTLCGSVNGAAAIIGMVAGQDAPAIVSELFGWYQNFPFPSDKHESYAKFKNQPTSVAKSPLCHVSVTTWCETAKKTVNSPERKDRCAKLTGDVAAKAAELLNQWADGKFAATWKPDAEYVSCTSCHVGEKSVKDNVESKMNCSLCHEDHTKKAR